MAMEGRTPVLKKSRWLLLKREENLKTEQRFRLRDLLRYNLRTVRAYLLKEAFQQLWDYNSATWAGKFLDEWCRQVMRSRIEPMKKIARSLPLRANMAETLLVPLIRVQGGKEIQHEKREDIFAGPVRRWH
jgi:transposase